ncbi:MAG: SRPBCC domain-containing protein [Rhodospirillaceae bacterium]|nr:SRPBCC domain-containing protein [Rhodospirillaceae bacterium]MDE0618175.1 SRPBCC domain-containing protein [Rhodospirillaceae bacterium]
MTDPDPGVPNPGQTRTGAGDTAGRRPDDGNIYLTLHRIIAAPVETVYAAWTDPDLLRQWLAPGDTAVARAIAETTIGGTFLVEMRGTDGKTWLTRGTYREVVPNRRVVHTWRWEGSDVESLVTVELEPESDGATRLTLTHSRFSQAEARDEHVRGWTGCLAKLEALYAG